MLEVDRCKSRCCQRRKIGYLRGNYPAGRIGQRYAVTAKGTQAMAGKEVLRISVLGKLALLRDGTPMQLPPSKKTRALLAYLAVTGRPYRRDRLCTMFWNIPDDPRAALRWSLSRLRPLVDDPDHQRIIADRENVELDRRGIEVDVLSLQSLVRHGADSSRLMRCCRLLRSLRMISSRALISLIVRSFRAGAPRNVERCDVCACGFLWRSLRVSKMCLRMLYPTRGRSACLNPRMKTPKPRWCACCAPRATLAKPRNIVRRRSGVFKN